MDNSTVLGFPDTSGAYRSLNSKCRIQYKRVHLNPDALVQCSAASARRFPSSVYISGQ